MKSRTSKATAPRGRFFDFQKWNPKFNRIVTLRSDLALEDKKGMEPCSGSIPYKNNRTNQDAIQVPARTFSRACATASSSFWTSSIVFGLTVEGLPSRPYFHLRNCSPVLG